MATRLSPLPVVSHPQGVRSPGWVFFSKREVAFEDLMISARRQATSSDLQRQSRIAFIWIALAPIMLALITWVGVREFRDRQQMVTQTRDTLQALESLQQLILGVQGNLKSYLIHSVDQRRTDVFESAESARREFKRVRSLTADNVSQRLRMREMERRLEESHRSDAEIIALHRQGDREAALLLLDKSEIAIEEFLAIARLAEKEEERLLDLRLGLRQEIENRLSLAFIVALLLNLVFLAWGFVINRRYVRMRDQADFASATLTRELEVRVAERTGDLNRTIEQLQRSNADLERFAYSASHDLQEPLRIVGSYVTLLARRYAGRLDPEADRFIRFAADGAQRMQDLINDLMSYSSIREESLNREAVSLDKAVESAVAYLDEMIEESNAQVTADPLPMVEGDRKQLDRVFRGLISNGVKFRRREIAPHIHISCANQDGEWVIAVADNGIGFETEYAGQIFEMFARLHPRGRYPGTGIGLAIAKRVIELHGGRIWVESKVNEGSVFHFTLPGALADERPVTADAQPVAADARLLAPDARPVAADARPVTPDARPITPDARPVASDGRPVAPDARLLARDTRPVAANVRPVAPDARLLAADARPVVAADERQ